MLRACYIRRASPCVKVKRTANRTEVWKGDKMTSEEKRTLMTLDGKVDIIPAQLSCEQLRIYRGLLIKYMSGPTPGMVSQAPGVPAARPSPR